MHGIIRTIPFFASAPIVLTLIAGLTALPVSAAESDRRSYVTTGDGNVWMTSYGECWRSPYPAEEDQSEFAESCGDVVDSDGDGVNDPDDRCPDTPEGVRVDEAGCALDSDGDGVSDVDDRCPGTPSGARVDDDGCALDSDGDGVADDRDECPATPQGADVLDDGCEVIELEGGIFELDSAELRPAMKRSLQDTAETIKARGEIDRIKIIGYTDSQGSADYNRDLSRRRAKAVADYLVNEGIDRDVMSVSWRGETNPVASNATEAGRAKNRRVTIQPR